MKMSSEPQTTKPEDGITLWLWQINNGVYVAYDTPYPCQSEGGDPLTLGEPAATAIFKTSVPGARHDN